MNDKSAFVIGGGIAGMSAALELASLGISVELVEKKNSLGGYAGQFTCKATDKCVKCGACIVEEKLRNILDHPDIHIQFNATVQDIAKADRFSINILADDGSKQIVETDAIVVASGFQPFNPENKPYGYTVFDNVITNLDLEKMLRQESVIKRPSDGKEPGKVAFIQCVGSRDSSINRLWCSRICCGSALRMAKLVKSRQIETDITFFYIDVQTFGKDFQEFYKKAADDLRMIRAIPGDIFKTEDDRLKATYFLYGNDKSTDEIFDLIVLSIGIGPGNDIETLSKKTGIKLNDTGFVATKNQEGKTSEDGIFTAGTTTGPKTIADTVSDAGCVAWEVAKFLKEK